MQSKHNFKAINYLFQDICNIKADFNKKIIFFIVILNKLYL